MSDTKKLTNEEKLAICVKCAKIVSASRKGRKIGGEKGGTAATLHELENIGFIHIKSDISRKAYSEAYYNMLSAVSKPRFDRLGAHILRNREMERRKCVLEQDLDTIVDIQDALMILPNVDREIAILYLILNCTQKELCGLLHLSQPTVSIKINSIKERLCYLLRDYR